MRTLKNPSMFPRGTVQGRRAFKLCITTAGTLALLSITFAAKAQVIAGQEDINDFGAPYFNQNNATYMNPDNVGPNACVPTSVAQGLEFLENYQVSQGNPDPFTTPLNQNNGVTAIDALAQAMGTQQNPATKSFGTSYPGRVTGTTSYLSPTGANPSSARVVGGQYDASYSAALTIGPTAQSPMLAVPTANFLADVLKQDDGVEFTMLWGDLNTTTGAFAATGGGHCVTLQEISYNAMTGTGTISFIDPGTGDWIDDATLTKTAAGNLYVTYPTGDPDPAMDADNGEVDEEAVFGADLDGAGGATGGIIINDLAEGVPDGALTAAMLGASILGLAALRRRYC